MDPELEQGGGTEHLGGAAGVLFAGQLEDKLVVADGLEGGFGHAQAINTALEHVLDGFELVLLHGLDATTRQHLQGELAAAPEVQPQLQREAGEQGAGRNRQGQDQGKPPLLTCHFRVGRIEVAWPPRRSGGAG